MRTHLSIISWLTLAAGLLLGLSSITAAAQTPPIDPAILALREARFRAALGEPLPVAADTPNQLPAATADPALVDRDLWSNVTFQAWADSSYELFSMNGKGQEINRLTNNPANDGRPRISPDNTRVLFTSNRDGDFEVYSMATDGSDLRQLTSNTWSDSSPCWSPDGRRIAFVSNATGTYELYTMNADGSELNRLTTSTNENVLYPAWSPDGTVIAFTTWPANGNYYESYIYTVSPTGGARNKILNSSNAMIENLVWSPDGQFLFMDTWKTFFPFGRIFYLRKGTSYLSQINVTTEGSYEDLLMGDVFANSDGGYSFLFVRANYIIQNQYYVIDHTHIETQSYSGNPSSATKLATGILFFPDRKLKDNRPPITRVKPLPPYWRLGTIIPVEWSLENPGLAPLDTVSLQYAYYVAPNGYGWSTIYTSGTASQSFSFNSNSYSKVDPPYRIYFRVSARDEAGNQEAKWLNDYSDPYFEASTILYKNEISGRLADARDQPFSGVHLGYRYDQMAKTDQTDAQGRYRIMSSSDTRSPLNFNEPVYGYGALPITPVSLSADRVQNLYYPPSDNQVQNGDFELPWLAPWVTRGDFLAQPATDTFATGTQSARITPALQTAAGQESVLEQTLSLPADLHMGTFSFVAQLQNGQSSPNSYVRVELVAGETVTRLHELRGSFNWRHFWSALEPWAGQTVTLRFSLHQAGGEPALRFNLDDVSVGSYWTPVIEQVTTSGNPLAVTPPPFTLHGQNFANLPAVWLDGVQLPDGAITWIDPQNVLIQPAHTLKLGCHTLKLVTPEGLSTSEPCALRAGSSTLLPLIVR